MPEKTEFKVVLTPREVIRLIALASAIDHRLLVDHENRAMIHQCRAWMDKMEGVDKIKIEVYP